MATNSIKLLTGNSHPQLAKAVADRYVKSEAILSTFVGLTKQSQQAWNRAHQGHGITIFESGNQCNNRRVGA